MSSFIPGVPYLQYSGSSHKSRSVQCSAEVERKGIQALEAHLGSELFFYNSSANSSVFSPSHSDPVFTWVFFLLLSCRALYIVYI